LDEPIEAYRSDRGVGASVNRRSANATPGFHCWSAPGCNWWQCPAVACRRATARLPSGGDFESFAGQVDATKTSAIVFPQISRSPDLENRVH